MVQLYSTNDCLLAWKEANTSRSQPASNGIMFLYLSVYSSSASLFGRGTTVDSWRVERGISPLVIPFSNKAERISSLVLVGSP
jgi:hypothetical protein